MKDLHLHLSGATNPVLLYEIIRENGLRNDSKNYFEFKKSLTMNKGNVKNLDEYVKVLHLIDEAQSSPSAIKKSFYSSYRDAFLNGCTYLELRWNPYKRSQEYKIDFDDLIIAARSGFEEAQTCFGIGGNMILCLGRDISDDANEGIFKKAVRYCNKGVCGIDVAGAEKKYPLKQQFEQYYNFANTIGLTTTCHIGEEFYDGVEDALATVIEKYKCKRIGHGVQIHRYPNLMKLAGKNNIMFEICITSNMTTGNVKTFEEYAKIFKIFEEYGLKYTICTDAVYPIDTNLTKEHEKYEKIMEIAKKM